MKINVDLLKDYRSDFSNEKSNFNSSSYGTFSSSYINRCSDSYIIRMKAELRKLYQDIEKAYKNIDSWWGDYNNDIESLERALSNDGRSGAIKASSVRSSVDVLPTLKNYSLSFSGIINLNFESSIPKIDIEVESVSVTGANISSNSMDLNNSLFGEIEWADDIFDIFSDTGAAISEGWEWITDKASDGWEYISDVSNACYNWLNDVNNAINEVLDRTAATVEVGCYSVVESVLVFGESLFDAGASLAGAGLSIFNEDIKEDIKSFVSKEHVKTWFDNIYETSYGQDLVNNAYFFDTTRQIGNGIGHTLGVVGLTYLTFGAATPAAMASIAGVSGFGTGTQNAWLNGADFGEGIITGTANAVWEGFQWWIGGKIGGFDGKIGKFTLIQDNGKIASKLLISLLKIGADALDGGVEGFVQPLINSIYQDGYCDDLGNYIEFTENDNFWKRYAELFDDAGGLANVGIQTLIGGGSSLIGELFDLSKILRESSETKVEINNEYVVPPDIKGIEKFKNADELYDAYIQGKIKLNILEYQLAMEYFHVRDRMVVEPDFGKSLEKIFFDDDYVIGVHRVGWEGNADSIIRDGLNLTGHSSSGAFVNNIDLTHNITFHDEYVSFLKALSEGSVYKRNNIGYGDAVIIKIPKSEINNLDSLVYYPKGSPVLKPEYVQGKVSSFIDENGKFHLTDNQQMMDIHIKTKKLNELIEIRNSEAYLQYLDDINSGESVVFNPNYDNLNIRIAELEKEIGTNLSISSHRNFSKISLEEQISNINNLMSQNSNGNYIIKVDSLDEIPVDFFDKFIEPDRLVLEVGDNKYTYSQFLELNQGDITALLSDATHLDYYDNWDKNRLGVLLHNLFDQSYGYDVIQRDVLDKIQIVDESQWADILRQKGLSNDIVGFVDGNSVMYLPSNANMHSATHESFHKVSELKNLKVYDVAGNIHKVTGIREFYNDGFTTTWANETLTEFLSSKYSDGKIYSSMYGVENVLLWNRIDEAIKKVDNRDLLYMSYFSNDTSYIRQFFDKYCGFGSYDIFVRKLQVWYSAQSDLNLIVTTIEKNVYKEIHPILYIIKSIFGGDFK